MLAYLKGFPPKIDLHEKKLQHNTEAVTLTEQALFALFQQAGGGNPPCCILKQRKSKSLARIFCALHFKTTCPSRPDSKLEGQHAFLNQCFLLAIGISKALVAGLPSKRLHWHQKKAWAEGMTEMLCLTTYNPRIPKHFLKNRLWPMLCDLLLNKTEHVFQCLSNQETWNMINTAHKLPLTYIAEDHALQHMYFTTKKNLVNFWQTPLLSVYLCPFAHIQGRSCTSHSNERFKVPPINMDFVRLYTSKSKIL